MHMGYEWVLVALMIAEANNAAQRLALPETRPITRDSLHHIFVMPPDLGQPRGRIDTSKYSYCFDGERLQYIHKLNPYGELTELQAIQRMLKTHEKSIINTNDAYRMATNWLSL